MSHNSQLEKGIENIINMLLKGIWKTIRVVFLGIRRLPTKKTNFLFLLIWVVMGWALIRFRMQIWSLIPEANFKKFIKPLVYIGFAFPVIYLYYKGEEFNHAREELAHRFEEIGFFSGTKKIRDSFTGEEYQVKNTPVLLKKEVAGKKVLYTFKSNIPFDTWRKKGKELETILDFHIVKVELAKNSKQIVTLHTIPAENGLGEFIPWDNSFVRLPADQLKTGKDKKTVIADDGKFTVVTGLSMLDEVAFDLVKNPHMLIAGLTGSGKSVLETCLAWQCIRKGAHVFMVDFKGGMEFGLDFEKYGEVVTERKRAIEILRELTKESELRMALFRREGIRDLEKYNEKHPKSKLARVILLCDEVGEMLDKEGADKDDKKEIEEISKLMSKLARLSRAPGINMILATQRPDAKVITGQIKANLTIRISGRMVDAYNSEMVLGNTKATEIGDTRGRFMYTLGADTFEFQAYAFNTSYMHPGTYKYGRLLIKGETDITQDEIDQAVEEAGEEEDQADEKKQKLKFIFKVPGFRKDPDPEKEKRRDDLSKEEKVEKVNSFPFPVKTKIEQIPIKQTTEHTTEQSKEQQQATIQTNSTEQYTENENLVETPKEALKEAEEKTQVEVPQEKSKKKVVVIDGQEFEVF